jgi:hypothetical protein
MPPRLRQQAAFIHGIHTQLLLLEFANKILLLVTQIGKFGNILQCTLDETIARRQLKELNESECSQLIPTSLFTVNTTNQSLEQLYATQLIELIAKCRPSEQRPVMVSITLHPNHDMNQSRDVLQCVEKMLMTCLMDA